MANDLTLNSIINSHAASLSLCLLELSINLSFALINCNVSYRFVAPFVLVFLSFFIFFHFNFIGIFIRPHYKEIQIDFTQFCFCFFIDFNMQRICFYDFSCRYCSLLQWMCSVAIKLENVLDIWTVPLCGHCCPTQFSSRQRHHLGSVIAFRWLLVLRATCLLF